ncbi:Hypothetical predicted protein [Marmota monax]|uniref:Uncharacterized protein n=1 Tax=Marmota monax TaxID=9995 RepID=A0A5E4CCH0_MARMO|nr:hypothetical protein GHT09_007253 [Marmota monax]VTJ78532.1 Hypothetical predicted protein [Marmota monax]
MATGGHASWLLSSERVTKCTKPKRHWTGYAEQLARDHVIAHPRRHQSCLTVGHWESRSPDEAVRRGGIGGATGGNRMGEGSAPGVRSIAEDRLHQHSGCSGWPQVFLQKDSTPGVKTAHLG